MYARAAQSACQHSLRSFAVLQIGVIRLSGFNARAQQDVAQAVKALTRQGASEFTLDVRDNRGGLYQEGAEVAKLFLEGKTPLTCLEAVCQQAHTACHT